jgi:hypothetical protein
MKINFLSAQTPITKTYSQTRSGNINKTPYPFVYEVNSYEYQVPTLEALFPLIQQHAEQGHCLLKGELSRPLVSESRAGSTDPKQKTEWVCLDLDGIGGYSTVDQFLQDVGCGETDYILQWSASQGVGGAPELRCHIFLMLDAPRTPEFLKRWLMTLNLTCSRLKEQLRLTRTNCSLRWGLDITTCQNDKLLYIAPPLFENMEDPLAGQARISFHKGKRRRLAIGTQVLEREALRNLSDQRINEQRLGNSMPKRKTTKYKVQGSVEYMQNPDTATVTDIKIERGFVYLNLNGGDSWGYYHPENNPSFIYNFKGEPPYKTDELLPEYWADIARRAQDYQPDTSGTIYLAFREFRTGNYYNGTFDGETSRLNLAMAKNETQLKHFLKQHGQPVGDYVPDWDLVFDPHSEITLDVMNRTVNTYVPSLYMEDLSPPKVTTMPPVCSKIIRHVMGDDEECVLRFLNWLACVVQFKDRTGTAWVLHGTQGTGKGLLFHHIIAPILGEHNTSAKRMEELESEFTGFVENKFVTAIDEIEVGSSLYHAKITAKLKNLIVEPSISIRKMYTPAYMSRNYNNMLFMSNQSEPLQVSPDDRRFNVAPYQFNKLQITTTEVDSIEKELKQMYAYLMHYPANRDMARTPLINQARETLIDISRSAVDVVSDALLAGNFGFFWDQLPSQKPPESGAITNPNHFKYLRYRELLLSILDRAEPCAVSRDDLYTMYDWCDGKIPSSPNKFTALLKHHRIHLTPVWVGKRTTRGIEVQWDFSDKEWVSALKEEVNNNTV